MALILNKKQTLVRGKKGFTFVAGYTSVYGGITGYSSLNQIIGTLLKSDYDITSMYWYSNRIEFYAKDDFFTTVDNIIFNINETLQVSADYAETSSDAGRKYTYAIASNPFVNGQTYKITIEEVS